MVAPILAAVAPALVGGALSALGGSNQQREARRQADLNYERQKEFAQHGLRWKVEDAKAAGLHPLFGIGGTGAAFASNPIHVGDNHLAQTGQNLARAASTLLDPSERQLRQATLEKLRAETQKSFAEASYFASEAARNAQQRQPTTGAGPQAYTTEFGSVVTPVPPSAVGHSLSHEPIAGQAPVIGPPSSSVHPGSGSAAFERFNWAPGFTVLLPGNGSGDATQGLEAVSESAFLMAAVIARNVQEFGPRWLSQAGSQFGGAFAAIDRAVQSAIPSPQQTAEAVSRFARSYIDRFLSRSVGPLFKVR